MKKVETTKIYLLVKRAEMIATLNAEGYNNQDIALIFNLDRSTVKRILDKTNSTN